MKKNKKIIFWGIELIVSVISMLWCASVAYDLGIVISLLLIVLGFIMLIISGAKEEDVPLTTDMEIFIAGLELRPIKNRYIKYIASYLEKNIIPNEEILAAPSFGNTAFGVLTNKRVIMKNIDAELIIPIEKINNVVRNFRVVCVNDNNICLASAEDAEKFVNMINTQITSYQTIQETIKIENKIVTEESITSQLQKLSNLHDSKVLSDYEYFMKKQELLDKMK